MMLNNSTLMSLVPFGQEKVYLEDANGIPVESITTTTWKVLQLRFEFEVMPPSVTMYSSEIWDNFEIETTSSSSFPDGEIVAQRIACKVIFSEQERSQSMEIVFSLKKTHDNIFNPMNYQTSNLLEFRTISHAVLYLLSPEQRRASTEDFRKCMWREAHPFLSRTLGLSPDSDLPDGTVSVAERTPS